MDSSEEQSGSGLREALPPPPPNVVPVKAEPSEKKTLQAPIARRGLGSKGRKLPLLTNHFKVNVTDTGGYFFHYSMAALKVIDRVHETYDTEFGKDFAYDGEKSLFTVGPLPRNKLEFTVVLDDVVSNRNNGNASPDGHGSPNETDRKRLRRPYNSKTFKVQKFPCKPLQMHCVVRNQRIPKKPSRSLI